jgi:uncharacterized protein YjbI with pentapeptide repeats
MFGRMFARFGFVFGMTWRGMTCRGMMWRGMTCRSLVGAVLGGAIAIALVGTLLPDAAIAASSAAIRSYDDAQVVDNNFAGQNLQQVEFTDADLDEANFSGADLQGGVFNGSSLRHANWHGVNFSYGITYLTSLNDADLSDGIFESALMLKTTFQGANVTGADFSNAVLDRIQVVQLCQSATGTNSVTGIDTRSSLGCSG